MAETIRLDENNQENFNQTARLAESSKFQNQTIRLDNENTSNQTIRLDDENNNATVRLNQTSSTIRLDEEKNNSSEITQKRKTFLGFEIIDDSIGKKAGGEADIFIINYKENKAFVKLYRQNVKVNERLLQKIKKISEKYDYFPNIYEVGKVEGRIYEIQEFLEGGSLRERLENIKEKENIKSNIDEFIQTISEALNILHKEGIIHRDLKPDNILYRNENEPILSDFGASTILDIEELSRRLTGARGTFDYFAPEVVGRDEKGQAIIGKEVDWWALGMIILEILDKHPLKGMHNAAMFRAIISKPIPIPENLDERYQLLLKGLLTKNEKKRWGYKEVKEWLEGKTPEVYYETSIVDEEFKLEFNGKKYSIEELAGEILKKENFDKAIKYFDKELWDGNIKSDRNPYRSMLIDLFDLETPEEKVIFFSHTILKENNKELPFTLYGIEITDNYVIELLQKYISENVSNEIDKKIISLMEEGIFNKLVKIYKKIYNKKPLKLSEYLPTYLDIENVQEFLNICANYFNGNTGLLKILLQYIAVPEDCAIELLSNKELYEIAKRNKLNENKEVFINALVANGYIDDVKKYVQTSNEKYLKTAFKYEQNEIINYLLDLGTNPNIEFIDKNGNLSTPLITAIGNNNKELVNKLLSLKANPNQEARGLLPLNVAIRNNNFEIVKNLINHKADVNKIESKYDHTPLMEAVLNENYEITKYLLQNKANPNILCDGESIT